LDVEILEDFEIHKVSKVVSKTISEEPMEFEQQILYAQINKPIVNINSSNSMMCGESSLEI